MLSSRGVDLHTQVRRFESDLKAIWSDLQTSAIEQAEMHRNYGAEEPELVELLFSLCKHRISATTRRYLAPAEMLGITQLEADAAIEAQAKIGEFPADSVIEKFNERTIKRLIGDVARPTLRIAKRATEDTDLKTEIQAVFGAIEYRLSLIANTEVPQAFWYGYATAAQQYDVDIELAREDDACEECVGAPAFENQRSNRMRLAAVPTIHPGCNCGLRVVSNS